MSRLALLSLLLPLLAACNLSRPAVQAAPPTADPGLVSTIAAQTLAALASPTSTRTPTPAFTLPPSNTPTSTPGVTPTYEKPSARFETNTNCRAGPGTLYPVVLVWQSGQTAEIVGKSETGDFWLVKMPNREKTCWVAGEVVQAAGSVHLLPAVTAPPSPTPAPPKAPGWQNWTYSCAYAPGGSNATVQMSWSDNAQNEDGYNIYRNGQVVAAFGPNVTTYTDTAFVAAGGSLRYYIEVYSDAGRARSSTITITCQ